MKKHAIIYWLEKARGPVFLCQADLHVKVVKSDLIRMFKSDPRVKDGTAKFAIRSYANPPMHFIQLKQDA